MRRPPAVWIAVWTAAALAVMGTAAIGIRIAPSSSSAQAMARWSWPGRAAQPDPPAADLQVDAYRSASCGCCKGWLDHIRAAGFTVRDHVVEDLEEVKLSLGVPGELASCHTAIVAGYVLEGHVPVSAVQRLLQQRPVVAGLAVPGMPLGSPGMESPLGAEPYTVVSFTADGAYRPFQRIKV